MARELKIDIIIEVKNVGQNFKPEQDSLKHLLADTHKFFEKAAHPVKLDGRVHAIFIPAKQFEYNPETKTLIPTERVEVVISYQYTKGGIQPPIISDFRDSALQIVKDITLFLNNTNNNDLFLPPALIIVNLSNPQYFVQT